MALHATRLTEEIEELTDKLEAIVEGINDAAQEISGDLGELLDVEENNIAAHLGSFRLRGDPSS